MDSTGFPNLEQVERQVHNSIWDDALIDLCAGAALFLMGVLWVTQLSPYGTFVAPLFIPIWMGARQRITTPRLGVVKFSADRVKHDSRVLAFLALLGTLSLTLGILWYFLRAGSPTVIEQYNLIAGLPAALLAVPAAVIAVAFGVRRFLIYSATLFWSAVPVILLDVHPGWAFIPAGIVCMALGGTLLAKFLRKYPREA